MPFFSGFAQGASDEITRQRGLEAQKTEADAQREQAALTHLATSPDPEIAAHAITGLLSQSTRKPGKGLLSSLFGATQSNPMLGQIKGLIQSGRPMARNTTEAAQGSMGDQPAEVGPQQEGSVLPSHATTPAVAGPPSAAGAAPHPTTPRHVFRTPDEQARLTEEATQGAKISGLAPYLSPEQRSRAAMGVAGIRTAPTMRFVPGVTPGEKIPAGEMDVDGNPINPQGFYRTQEIMDPATNQITRHHIPTGAPMALQVKPTYQVLAAPEDGNRPHAYRIMPDGTKTDLGAKAVVNGLVQGTDEATGVNYSLQVPRTFTGGAAASPPPAAPGVAAGTARSGQVAAPPPAAPAGRVATPPPTAPASTLPRGAISRGRTRTFKPEEGAILGPDGQPQVVTAQYDDKVGKYYDSTDPTKELSGFIPGKEGPELVKAVASSQTTESTLDRAIEALKTAGLDKNTDPAATAKLMNQYYSGKGDDPISTAVAALASFAQIQGGGQYIQGTRSFQYIKQIQAHLPVVPTAHQAALHAMTAGLASPTNAPSRFMGQVWDAPAQMIEKLELAKTNLQNVRKYAVQAAGKVPARATGQGGAAAAAPPANGQRVGPGEVHPEGTEGTVNGTPAVWKTVNGQAGWYAK